jgi:hypothetical protein
MMVQRYREDRPMTPPTDEIEQATDEFPQLGYTVIASLKGSEVQHDELAALLASLNLSRYLPALPEPRTSLRRAIRAWLKERAASGAAGWLDDDDEEDLKTKRLIREISAPRAPWLTLALVEENIDLAELGLSYLTNLRVIYDRTTDILYLTTTPTGRDGATQTRLQDQALLASLEPLWEHYRTLHIAGDLARMVQDIIADMDASAMRRGGGVYFVPYARRAALARLKHLIEVALPAAPGEENASSLVHIPIIDRPTIKKQMARIAHKSFMAELTALQKDLERFIEQASTTTTKGKPGRIKRESMLARLADYQAMKAKVGLYSEMLGMRQQEILRGLDQLQTTARTLLETAAAALGAEEDAGAGCSVPVATGTTVAAQGDDV